MDDETIATALLLIQAAVLEASDVTISEEEAGEMTVRSLFEVAADFDSTLSIHLSMQPELEVTLD